MAEEESVKYPGQHDFLLGRGGETNNHSGNILFRQLIKEYKEAYQNAPKTQKPLISQKLVAKWRAMSPPGRFLERSEPDKTWKDVGDAVACRKTSKALGERGKRNKQGGTVASVIGLPTSATSEALAGTKRQIEDLDGAVVMSPTATNKVKLTPTTVPSSAVGTAASAAKPETSVLMSPTTTTTPASTAGGLSSVLQSMGATQATTGQLSVATAAPSTATGLAALLEQHKQQQQQQSNLAALLELQKRQQQPKPDLAALLGQATATTSTGTDLAALLEQHKKQNELSALLGQTGAATDLAGLLEQQSKRNELAALLEQQQKKQQAQSSLAALLEQHQQPKHPSDLSALLEQHQKNQQVQASLAALLSQQPQQQHQEHDLASLLEQQQLQSSLAALLEQKKQQADLAALLGQQQNGQAHLHSSIAAVLEQQQKSQQLQSGLAAILGQQQNQQSTLAALLEERKPPAADLSGSRANGERISSLLSATSGGQSGTQPRRQSLLMTTQANPVQASAETKASAAANGNLADILAALGRQGTATTASSLSLAPNDNASAFNVSSRLRNLISGTHAAGANTAAPTQSPLSLALSTAAASSSKPPTEATQAPGKEDEPCTQGRIGNVLMESLVQRQQQQTQQPTIPLAVNSSAKVPQQQQRQGPSAGNSSDTHLMQLLAARQGTQPQTAAAGVSAQENQGATAAFAAALGRMDSNLVQQFRMQNTKKGQR